jgi:chromosome segregation ATPase
MKRILLSLLATTMAAGVPAAASAQNWNVNERQAQLEQRIEAGQRGGGLTVREADRLREEFRAIRRLERDYRTDGLSPRERQDLDRRFNQLSQQIRAERSDNQNRSGQPGRRSDRWENLNQRQAQFRQRLNTAVADRRLTSRQAANLQVQFDSIARLERDYRRNGLTQPERADLDRRLNQLQANFRSSLQGNQYNYGYGQAPNLFDYLFGIR